MIIIRRVAVFLGDVLAPMAIAQQAAEPNFSPSSQAENVSGQLRSLAQLRILSW